jgi:hypothetical protein
MGAFLVVDSGAIPPRLARIVPGSFSPPIGDAGGLSYEPASPGSWPTPAPSSVSQALDELVGGAGAVVLSQDIPLSALQAQVGLQSAIFAMGSLLPAGAMVFPSTAQIQVVQPFEGGPRISSALAAITGGYYPGSGRFSMPSNAADCTDQHGYQYYGGGANSDADVGCLNATQGGQQLLCQVAVMGLTLDQLAEGHLRASILYVVP